MIDRRSINLISTSFEYVFVILMLCNFFCVYFGYNNPMTNVLFNIWQVMLFFIGSISIEILIKNNKGLYEKFLQFLLILVPLFFVFCVVNSFNFGFPISFYFLYLIDPILLVAYFIEQSKRGRLYNLVFKFENIMIILAIFSLVGWILFTFNFKPNTYIQYIWESQLRKPGFFFVDFLAQGTTKFFHWSNFVRNTGIFTEAPMYSHFLCMAFFVELFLKNKSLKRNYLIIGITIFTTSSTTGIIFLLVSVFYKYVLTVKKETVRFFLLILTPALFIFIKYILSMKQGNNSIYTSYAIRSNDVYAGFSSWMNHIFIGNGINNVSSMFAYLYSYRIQVNNVYISNGLLTILSYGGILYALFYVIPVALSIRKSLNLFGFALGSLFLLYFENLQSITFTIFIFSFILAAAILRRDYEK